ncbi:unnamed protein product [Diatraea saccharalis]|uniref:RING-type E3 ubiquitin transferase n=1 Tax=Diatraea saccharalis TaxID=40085 RepID=A0A9N9QTB0_9NEOP|nr:unnamed protein product [Diatraea saccharalis]
MAAKSKKRLSKIENKLLKLDKLELQDVFCSICHSILIEPVTLPCFHDFCLGCFNGSIENNALCCPLCRLRIGSWLRNATKQKNLVNIELWNFIKLKFSHEIDTKVKGEDNIILEEPPLPRLSAPGEIRLEYEAELKRLRDERLQLEHKHIKETESLIHKIQEEEEEAHKKYLEALKKDEILALQIQNEHNKTSIAQSKKKNNLKNTSVNSKFKNTKIERFLDKTFTAELKK